MKNIAEILKNAPKGLKLYSPVVGEVEFVEVDEEAVFGIKVMNITGCMDYFDEFGRYCKIGDCCLFPSKEHQSWDNWQEVLIPQCLGIVIITERGFCNYEWAVIKNGMFALNMYKSNDNYLRPFEEMNFKDMRFATPDETEKFFKELDRQGYKFENGIVTKKESKQNINFYEKEYVVLTKSFSGQVSRDGGVFDLNVGDVFYCDGKNMMGFCNVINLKNGEQFNINPRFLRGWTVKDAKDGDLLSMDDFVFLYKSKQSNITANAYIIIGKYDNKIYTDDWCDCDDSVTIASDNEKAWFYRTLIENGYYWNPIKKNLYKLEYNCTAKDKKFTINDFKPFDKVIARGFNGVWKCSIFSHHNAGNYITTDSTYTECVPYNEETAHLLGTAENYEGKYKTW